MSLNGPKAPGSRQIPLGAAWGRSLNAPMNPVLPKQYFIPDVEAHQWDDGRLPDLLEFSFA